MEQLTVLKERQRWMHARIEAKKSIGWETQWDERELAALTWAIDQLGMCLEDNVDTLPLAAYRPG